MELLQEECKFFLRGYLVEFQHHRDDKVLKLGECAVRGCSMEVFSGWAWRSRKKGGGVSFGVKVVAGSSRSRIVGLLGEVLKVTVAHEAQKGKANAELIRLLAKGLSRSRSEITIEAGLREAKKIVHVTNMSRNELLGQLDGFIHNEDVK